MVWKLSQIFKSQENAEKKNLKKGQWISIILCGIVLLLISLPVEKRKDEQRELNSRNQKDEIGNGMENEIPSEDSLEEYTIALEDRIENALSKVLDVGKTEVVITLASSVEKIIEKEKEVQRANTEEKDAQGGTRSISNVNMGDKTVYHTKNGDSEPYVIKIIQPKVEGVIVIAQGAGTREVNRNVTEAVQVLLGVEAHRVKVFQMNTSIE